MARAAPGGRAKREGFFVICGAPGSGKSTYVKNHRRPGDFVWDYDDAAQFFFGAGRIDVPPVRSILIAMFCSVKPLIQELPSGSNAFWIVTSADCGADLADELGASLIVLNVDRQECIRRVLARDPAGDRRDEIVKVIDTWKAPK